MVRKAKKNDTSQDPLAELKEVSASIVCSFASDRKKQKAYNTFFQGIGKEAVALKWDEANAANSKIRCQQLIEALRAKQASLNSETDDSGDNAINKRDSKEPEPSDDSKSACNLEFCELDHDHPPTNCCFRGLDVIKRKVQKFYSDLIKADPNSADLHSEYERVYAMIDSDQCSPDLFNTRFGKSETFYMVQCKLCGFAVVRVNKKFTKETSAIMSDHFLFFCEVIKYARKEILIHHEDYRNDTRLPDTLPTTNFEHSIDEHANKQALYIFIEQEISFNTMDELIEILRYIGATDADVSKNDATPLKSEYNRLHKRFVELGYKIIRLASGENTAELEAVFIALFLRYSPLIHNRIVEVKTLYAIDLDAFCNMVAYLARELGRLLQLGTIGEKEAMKRQSNEEIENPFLAKRPKLE